MIEQAQNARSIFLEIVEKVPRERWAESLDQACGENAPLRTEVQRLYCQTAIIWGGFLTSADPNLRQPYRHSCGCGRSPQRQV